MLVVAALLVFTGGLCSAFQSPTNATLSTYVGNFQSATISFLGGVITLVIAVALLGNGDFTLITQAQWWQVIGGLYGAFMVLMITYTAPVLGIALTLTVNMFGQIVMGMIIDTFGLFMTDASPLSPLRVVGALAVGAGILLVYIGKNRQSNIADNKAKAILVGTLMFLAGVGAAIQTPTNAALAAQIGKLEASTVSFAGGFLALLIFTLITYRGKLKPVRGVGIRPWMVLGGVYGAIVVFVNIVGVPYLGAALVVATAMFGSLTGALFIDNYGWLRAARVDMNKWRYIGVGVIALGVILVTIARM